MYRIDVGLDLGSSNIRVFVRDKGVVIDQPSVVAYERKTRKIVAVGIKARRMIGKTTEDIVVERPIRRGVISNYTLTERMIKAFIKNALRKRKIWGRPNICVAMPCNISQVEKKAVEDAVIRTGAKMVYTMDTPIAAALGAGIDILETQGHMIVDVGGGLTEIAVISSGGISEVKTLKLGGDDFTDALIKYARRNYNVLLGEVSAEDSKIDGAAVYPQEEDDTFEIKGKNMLTGLPVKIDLHANEMVDVFKEIAGQISDAIVSVLDVTQPELVADITKEGILLSGGGSNMPGLAKFMSERIGINVITSDEPESFVAIGSGSADEFLAIEGEMEK